MLKRLLILSLGIIIYQQTFAQVGIGNPTPNAGSILDLTNANNKALLLPSSSMAPSSVTSFNTEGMLFYYQSNLHLKLATGIKVITPWNYNGTPSNGLWSQSGLPVGIGRQPVVSSGALLTIGPVTNDVDVTGSNGSIVIGDNNFDSTHMLIDRNEIMVKTNATNGGILNLQQEGGTVEVRTGAAKTANNVLTAKGSINAGGQGRIRENGFDLLPVGTIIMWFGSVDAGGYPLVNGVRDSTWHICDGGMYDKVDGSGTASTPDLRERFIVGAGSDNAVVTGTSGYAVGAGGDANNFITLTSNEMPTHNHTATTSNDGAHTHSLSNFVTDGLDHDASGGGGEQYWRANSGGSSNTNTTGSNHDHTINVGNAGSGNAHENRPPYYALYFLMKL